MRSRILARCQQPYLGDWRNRSGPDTSPDRGRLHHGREGCRRDRLGRNICPHVHSPAPRRRRPSSSKPNHPCPRNMVRGTGQGR